MSNFQTWKWQKTQELQVLNLGKHKNVANINKNSTWICFKHLFTETANNVNTSRTHVPLDGLCS